MEPKKLKIEELINILEEDSDAEKEYDSDHFTKLINKAYMSEEMLNQKVIETTFDSITTKMKKDNMNDKLFSDSFKNNAHISLIFFYREIVVKIFYALPILMLISALVLGVWGGFGLGTEKPLDPTGLHPLTNMFAFMGIAICFSVPSIIIALGFLPNMIINKRKNNTFSRMRLNGFNKKQLLFFLFNWTFVSLLATQIFIWQIWTPLFTMIISNDVMEKNVINITDLNLLWFFTQMFITNSVYIFIGIFIGFTINNPKVFMSILSTYIAFILIYILFIRMDAFACIPYSELWGNSDAESIVALVITAFIYNPFNIIQHGFVLSIHDKNNFLPISGELASKTIYWTCTTKSYYTFNEFLTIIYNALIISYVLYNRERIVKFI